jgi:nickel-dependent lactate racemase
MIYLEIGGKDKIIDHQELKTLVIETMEKIGPARNVLAIPPDYTRFHSQAGIICQYLYEYFGQALQGLLPALGTHSPMTPEQRNHMFGDIPGELFKVHDWRNDVLTLGEVPGDYVHEVSGGKVSYPWPAQVNKQLIEGGHDLILSVGQVVPHEVVGMANYNKNIFVGTGGPEGINKSHFLGAAYGMEKMMGRAITPVRQVLNYASNHFTSHLPIVYILTVIGRDEAGKLVTRGLFIGDDEECFEKAADVSLQVNFEMLDEPLKKVVVYLDPSEFKSTWLGNKAIYRTRMALADNGELIILAPGVKEFGEDRGIDRLIRKYGYKTTPEILSLTDKNDDLQGNLSAAAHLIHGSSEGRFTITYCPGYLTKEEIESVNFHHAPLEDMLLKYNPRDLKDGFNTLPDGEEIYYISNPALGLWAWKDKF